MIEIPDGEYEIPGHHGYDARIRNNRVELLIDKMHWRPQGNPNGWPDDWRNWIIGVLADLKPVDRPAEVARMRAIMNDVIALSPNIKAIKSVVMEAK